MGYKLMIRDFGPIRKVNVNIRNINLFIGPQVSGKSAIAKMVYFFLSLGRDVRAYLNTEENRTLPDFERIVRQKFAGFWGTAEVEPTFAVKFEYAPKKCIELAAQSNGDIEVEYSPDFEKELSSIFYKANMFGQSLSPSLEQEFSKMTGRLFERDMEAEIIYIPSGRNILSVLPDFLHQQIVGKTSFNNRLLELPLIDFIERISVLQRDFNKSLDEVIENVKALSSPNDMHRLNIARKRVENVLKATYRYDRNGAKIVVGGTEIQLAFASSGQQESLWIVMTLFYLILKQTNAFIIVEEPEAHLFSEGQKHTVELMALAANMSGNQLIVTTHSPYILSSFNNLIYACQVGQKSKQKAGKIIDHSLWVEAENVNAFWVGNGGIRSIIDEKLKLIKAEEIDKVSGGINDEFNRLAEI
jgi:energy-coupling factor transporter ATP-binding protein EcfA2